MEQKKYEIQRRGKPACQQLWQHSCTHINDGYGCGTCMAIYQFHVFPDMMKESAGKQHASDYNVIFVTRASGIFACNRDPIIAVSLAFVEIILKEVYDNSFMFRLNSFHSFLIYVWGPMMRFLLALLRVRLGKTYPLKGNFKRLWLAAHLFAKGLLQ